MTTLITPGEIAELQALTPYLDIKPLPRQLEHAVCLYLRGMSPSAAAQRVGYSSPRQLNEWVKSEEGVKVLEYIQKKHFHEIRVTKDSITQMFFEAHAKAANATEEIAATREIAKLHDLYENEKRKGAPQVNVQINNTQNVTNQKQLERMTDEKLMELAGGGLGAVFGPGAQDPEPVTESPDPLYDPIDDV